MKTALSIITFAAAAAAATCGVAHAQSSVKVFGVVDMGLTKGNGGTATNAGANGGDKAWSLRQAKSSRLGFQGNEDLGDGLSVQFLLDHRFEPDTGAAAAIFWHGRSYIQLTSKRYGSLWMGRDYMPAFYMASRTHPFGWDGVGQMGTSQMAGYRAINGVRTPNTLGYKSPRINGFSFRLSNSFGEGETARETGLNIEYQAGALWLGVGYDTMRGGPSATDGNRLVNAGLTYDLGRVKPMLYLARTKTAGGTVDNQAWSMGALVKLGAGSLKVAYGQMDPDGDDNTVQKFSIGYDYPLSKRTALYADFGLGKEDQKTDNRAIGFGLRHSF